jgi:hypothetical protein
MTVTVTVYAFSESMRSVRWWFIFQSCTMRHAAAGPMRSMRSMRGGFTFRNRGPSLKVHRGRLVTRSHILKRKACYFARA